MRLGAAGHTAATPTKQGHQVIIVTVSDDLLFWFWSELFAGYLAGWSQSTLSYMEGMREYLFPKK